MPIRWSPLRVAEAMDMLEDCVNQAVEPLEQARIVAQEALEIPNLPQYVDQHIGRIISEIDRAIGGSQWEPVGRLKAGIKAVRESLPEGAVDEEKKRLERGSQLSLAT
jgi:phage-related protein